MQKLTTALTAITLNAFFMLPAWAQEIPTEVTDQLQFGVDFFIRILSYGVAAAIAIPFFYMVWKGRADMDNIGIRLIGALFFGILPTMLDIFGISFG